MCTISRVGHDLVFYPSTGPLLTANPWRLLAAMTQHLDRVSALSHARDPANPVFHVSLHPYQIAVYLSDDDLATK